jgi:hypothetical protein
MALEKDTRDFRPESAKVSEGSIRILHPGQKLSDRDKVKLWKPFISESLPDLEGRRAHEHVSIGIVRPDPDSLRFYWKPAAEEERDDEALMRSVVAQNSLFEKSLRRLQAPEYSFRYKFTSGGKDYDRKLTDWEVYAAWYKYKNRYGDSALEQLHEMYQNDLPKRNLHFFLGTVKAHPHQFIIIGLLRTPEDLGHVDAQHDLGF